MPVATPVTRLAIRPVSQTPPRSRLSNHHHSTSRSSMPTALLEDLRHDIRYTRRMLRSNPGFAAIAILILAIGIGATTAIFSVVNATLLRPLPFREPDRLMSVFLRMPVQYGSSEIDMTWSYPKYKAFLPIQRTFGASAIHVVETLNIWCYGWGERVRGESVSAT